MHEPDPRAHLTTHGYALLDPFLSPAHTAALRTLCEPHINTDGTARPGVRRILEREPRLIDALRSTPVPHLITGTAGPGALIVRSILFDKSPDANWTVPWHQDGVIALRERADVAGFGPWSIKDGEPHARPPRDILDQIAVLRISLDPCPHESGPLLIIPATHTRGLLPQPSVDAAATAGPVIECATTEGGAVLMRPHTIHASARSTSNTRRRVLHLEFTAAALPPPLHWGEAVALR